MQYLIDRINHQFSNEIIAGDLVVAIVTGDKESNYPLEQMHGAKVIYGNPRNIPRRHLEAAHKLGISYIVSVDGDDVLCSPAAMRTVYERLKEGQNLVRVEGLPLGLNVSGYSTYCLERAVADSTAAVLETGWGRIFNKESPWIISEINLSDTLLRFTLDYPEDLAFFRTILNILGRHYLGISDKDLVDLVLRRKLYKITAPIAEEYWATFNKQKAAEIRGETK
jgi:spore coat polysaccharide biosynthesis protein SpsF (cytidylyltransferase family)